MLIDGDKLIQEKQRLVETRLKPRSEICKECEKQINQERKIYGSKPIVIYPDYIYRIKKKGRASAKILGIYSIIGINIETIKRL